jgi:hypothetical protein
MNPEETKQELEEQKKDDKRMIIILCSIIGIIIVFVIVGAIINRHNPKTPYYIIKGEESNTPKKEIKEDEEEEEEPKEEIDPNENPFPEVELNIEKVIKEYELDNLKDIINEDKDLFKQYAYTIINNNKIAYKKELLDSYIVIYKNKEQLDLNSLINSLKELMVIEIEEQIDTNTTSNSYDDGITCIKILKGSNKNTIYQEIMHFLDNRLIGKSEIYTVCYENGKYLNKIEECTKTIKLPISKLITEAGTKTNIARYFNTTIDSNTNLTNIYNLLAFILGEQILNEIYFSNSSVIDLFLEMNKYGISQEEFIEFINNTNDLINKETFTNEEKIEEEYLIKILNTIDTLYQRKYGHGWEEDKEFSFLMRIVYNHTQYYKEESNINNYLNIANFAEGEKQIIQNKIELNTDQELTNDKYYFIINDNKTIIGIDNLLIEYDIKENKTINYKKD